MDQIKDSLWVPGLVEKVLSGQKIIANSKEEPILKDFNIFK
jgi:hypothetical protein